MVSKNCWLSNSNNWKKCFIGVISSEDGKKDIVKRRASIYPKSSVKPSNSRLNTNVPTNDAKPPFTVKKALLERLLLQASPKPKQQKPRETENLGLRYFEQKSGRLFEEVSKTVLVHIS